MISGDQCLWCDKAKAMMDENNIQHKSISLDDNPELFIVMKAIEAKTVPQVFKLIGGYESTKDHINARNEKNAILDRLLFIRNVIDHDENVSLQWIYTELDAILSGQ